MFCSAPRDVIRLGAPHRSRPLPHETGGPPGTPIARGGALSPSAPRARTYVRARWMDGVGPATISSCLLRFHGVRHCFAVASRVDALSLLDRRCSWRRSNVGRGAFRRYFPARNGGACDLLKFVMKVRSTTRGVHRCSRSQPCEQRQERRPSRS